METKIDADLSDVALVTSSGLVDKAVVEKNRPTVEGE